ncbi:SHOCT domain-containing protein [Glaciihabitans sp. dw_435]|uniref:SHOCT domain-containing protein n=1 Tax=Glaciihabitans sp. dw_435 TaxID=2720081 RepID=UPI001BD5750C|nr:SHOCT domain-containing protein [Glaciihabitans sp. dw_435]
MPLFRRFGRPGLLGLAARTAVVAGTATAVTGGMRRHQQARATEEWQSEQYESEQAAANLPPEAPGVDLVAELQKLEALRQQGVLSDEEFASAKAKLLA